MKITVILALCLAIGGCALGRRHGDNFNYGHKILIVTGANK